jgi:hypothetical protein
MLQLVWEFLGVDLHEFPQLGEFLRVEQIRLTQATLDQDPIRFRGSKVVKYPSRQSLNAFHVRVNVEWGEHARVK